MIVLPKGGLGNQLFIYATGLELANRNSGQLVIDKSWFENQKERTFELDSFESSGVHELGVWQPSSGDRFPRAVRYLDKAFGRRLQNKGTFGQKDFFYDSSLTSVALPVSLSGYFQSPLYFQHSFDLLRKQLKSITHKSPWFEEQVTRLRDLGSWIGVHVRLGDYLEPHARS